MHLTNRLLATALAAFLIAHSTQGQDNNPTGPAGAYNGNVTTGGSYDPFTTNATRSVTDLVAPGAVGTYPLAFTRTMNSRGTGTSFGAAGAWRHSYEWSIAPTTRISTDGTLPAVVYDVQYPDGRHVIFNTHRNGDPDFDSQLPGVSDRFEGVPHGGTGQSCYLRLADGGRIRFNATEDVQDNTVDFGPYTMTWTFRVSQIIDPYGQATDITTDPVTGNVTTVTEHAGRKLKINFVTGPAGDTVVSNVQSWLNGSLTRQVTYGYTLYTAGTTNYSSLTSVDYPGTTASAQYSYQPSNMSTTGVPLIKTCIDAMYAGPMWRIGYVFQPNATGVVYGQIKSENYYDGNAGHTLGAAVSTLSVTSASRRTETRGDGPTRSFTYNGYQLVSATDFKNVPSYRGYDANGFINSVTDFNSNVTNFTDNHIWTGARKATAYPLTPSDTALGLGRATSGITFGSSTCPDTNNRDSNNPYYPYTLTNQPSTSQKLGHAATYLRNANKQVTTINHPDGGGETFVYDPVFGQLTEHRLKTGGLERFEYDSRGLLRKYRDAYHLATADSQNPTIPTNANPSLTYGYDTDDRVNSITDDQNNVTTFTTNWRGQMLTVQSPGATNAATKSYNPNGTIQFTTSELLATTSYTYDGYRRVKTVTLPPPGTGPSPAPTQFWYDHTLAATPSDDYTHTDANVWKTILPTGKTAQTAYDANNRRQTVTVSPGVNSDVTQDQAVTTFTYDSNGNVKTVKDPNGQTSGKLTTYWYDQQNRLTDVDDAMVNDALVPHKNANGHTVSCTYDQSNNKLTERRANDQVISNIYDAMNHVHQATVPQTPNPAAVTIYTYASTGLLNTMEDANHNIYTYRYDLIGRKTKLTYPTTTITENWSYNGEGGVGTYQNRTGETQTFVYDARHRLSYFTWSGGVAPRRDYVYDDASQVKQITTGPVATPITTIKNAYYNDGTLQSQEEWAAAENVHRTVNYTYDTDLKRSSIAYPGGDTFNFSYSNRGQLYGIGDTNASNAHIYRVYGYDHNDNLVAHVSDSTGVWMGGGTFNPVNQLTHAAYLFTSGSGGTRNIDCAYDEMNDRTSITRDGGTDTFGYDLNQQSTTATQNGTASSYTYDANGNRTGSGYVTNNLNQTTTFNNVAVTYGGRGNISTYGNASYLYDAQNRLTSATVNGNTVSSVYDGLGRRISQTTGGVTTYNVWDGWNLIEEFASAATAPTYSYVYGTGGVAVRIDSTGNALYYYQDALGSTAYVADSTGALKEYYKYDRFGQPTAYLPSGASLPNGSALDIRHLFTGQLWMPKIGLYDYRARMYSPVLLRFLQPDPIRFAGDPTNLYRYVGNNPANNTDPTGLYPYVPGPDPLAESIRNIMNAYGEGARLDAQIAQRLEQLQREVMRAAVNEADRTYQPYGGEVEGPGGTTYDENGMPLPSYDGAGDPHDNSNSLENAAPGAMMGWARADSEADSAAARLEYYMTTAGFGGGGSFDFAPGGGGRISEMIQAGLLASATQGSNAGGDTSGRINGGAAANHFPDMRSLSIQPSWMSGGGNGGAFGLWVANPAFLVK